MCTVGVTVGVGVPVCVTVGVVVGVPVGVGAAFAEVDEAQKRRAAATEARVRALTPYNEMRLYLDINRAGTPP